MHYIAINLAGAALFLIGVSLIYGATGTLNMADLAARIATLADGDRALLEGGAAILGIAFLIKAGMWPLGLWLPATYTAAAAPVAAIFAILSKVGIYVILRLSLLLFGADAGASNGFGESWLLYGGLATMAFGAFGVLASQAMGRLNGFYILVSSGTLLAAIGTANVGVISGALFYMVSSTLTISVFFLLVELVERAQDPAADVLAVTREAYGDEDEEEEEDEVGVAIPATLAILGLCFTGCGLLLAGMPPLSGFIGKFALLNALFGIGEQISSIPATTWLFAALLIFSGLSAMIAMMRAGIRTFWAPVEGVVPRVMLIEIVPVGFLLLLCVAMTVGGGPVMRYMDATAHALHAPSDYVHTVLGTRPVPRDKAGGH
jgi:multicomponent K+:H+ antiporter subunit D